MLTLIDLDLGNIKSVANALKKLGEKCHITSDPNKVLSADKLIFPGVGNFFEAAKRLEATGIRAAIRKKVLDEKIPILGICLGMQLFASYGDEGGGAEGLGLIKGKVSLLRSSQKGLRLPHIGWNDVASGDIKVFSGIQNKSCFYFVHSYEFVPDEPDLQIATSDYGCDLVAFVQKGPILGAQFHPEKSQEAGLKLLKNFCEGVYDA